ncbi:amino acid ABC transporter substrate-binding protein [Paralimibaculum aggregatum]|uniref:Amino acid ABC transporter substrate-binding protein n=1 Tax=Paralimibaculum aggregatum TaxID=3036245 RepID=A0ABQ6LT07_9RHOB|nr:amino acid ABC transporter substrate-binding protein [Limibaculum sp. NKW23]GMG85198.1 amino acid ABC transporter substrate-binding protein [Limibaculum sp. NKW23]
MRTAIILSASALLAFGQPAAADTLENVQAAGKVTCGVNGSRAGFSSIDSQGRWQGLDVDTCRAIAAATLGDAEATEFVKTTSQTRFTALQTGEIDVLTRNTTMTYSRDGELGVDFAAITFYDGQGFMVPADLGVTSIEELDGAAICVLPGTTAEQVVESVFSERGLNYTPIVFQDAKELSSAFFAGRCDAHIQSSSGLASTRATLAPNPEDYVILPKIFDKDPMGPVVRQDDARWKDIVAWTVHAMVTAEEMGITSGNVDDMRETGSDTIKRLLGAGDTDIGAPLGLNADWIYQIVSQVGNYGEVYDRNLGSGSPMNLARGQNALWKDGGLIYAPPLK